MGKKWAKVAKNGQKWRKSGPKRAKNAENEKMFEVN